MITCAPNVPDGKVYQGYQNRLWPQREVIDGIDVVRVWTYLAANAGGLKRILNYVSYMMSAVLVFTFFCRRPHLVVSTSPQFFNGWAGLIASWVKWCPFVLEIRDIWPESIVTVGAMKEGVLLRLFERMERWMYRGANHIVTVGNGYRENIQSKAGPSKPVSVVTNGVDLELFSPQKPSAEFREKYQLGDRFVCSYVGTIGMAHGLGVVVQASKRLKEMGRQDIVFCLIGDGASREKIQQQAAAEGVSEYVRFTGRLPKSQMPVVLASSDCLLIHLKKADLFQTVIPSKLFESMAMERPLIMGVQGESAEIVRQSKAGVFMESENAQQLVDEVVQLCDQPDRYQMLCENGRNFVAENYSRDALAHKMLDILEQVASR